MDDITTMNDAEAEIRAFYRNTYGFVVERAQRLLKHDAEARDVSHKVFLRAWRNWTAISCSDNRVGWLLVTTTRLCIRRLRHRKIVGAPTQSYLPEPLRSPRRRRARYLLQDRRGPSRPPAPDSDAGGRSIATTSHPTALTLMRQLAHDLPLGERHEVARHLEACTACRVHTDTLEIVQTCGRAEAPPLRLPESRLRPSALLAPAFALASVLSMLLLPSESAPRAKGGLRAQFLCKVADEVRPCKAGEALPAGASIMMRVDLASDAYLMLLGQDGSGAWTTYYPAGGDEAEWVQHGQEKAVGHSLRLDDTPGVERFFLFHASRPFARSEVLVNDRAAADELAEDIEVHETHFLKVSESAALSPPTAYGHGAP